MKYGIWYVFVLVFACYACGDGDTDRMTEAASQQPNGATEVTNDLGWDQAQVTDFMQKAAAGGMLEVQLGQLAAEKATVPEVKNFGQMMASDHGNANDQLRAIAQQLQVSLPTALPADKQQKVNDLQALSGEAFTSKYIDEMIADHQADISLLQGAQPRVSDPQLKRWIDSTLPVMQKHLQEIQQIKDARSNM